MRPIDNIVQNYLIELKNAGITSFHRAEIVVYLKNIGINTKNSDKSIDGLIERKEIIPLKNGKLTFVPRKR
ncbi:hypothetical protein HYX02_06365 [Candidatus Woesearchaeota archaeon]|nr:hypothetical protein [Candidatus Woesearchaeota archaeon]